MPNSHLHRYVPTRLLTLCLPLMVAASWAGAQRRAAPQSDAIALDAAERIGTNPLQRYPGGLSLYSYVDVDGREHLRIRLLDAALGVRSERDIVPPSGYRALKWLPVAGGAWVVGVFAAQNPGGTPWAPLLVEGYAVADGRRSFSYGADDFDGDTEEVGAFTACSPDGEHAGVTLVTAAGEGRRYDLTVLLLDRGGALASASVHRALRLRRDYAEAARMSVAAGGEAALAFPSRSGLGIIQVSPTGDAVAHYVTELPGGHRPLTFEWLARGGNSPTDRGSTLVGLAERKRLWRTRPASFAIELSGVTGASRSAPVLALHRMSYGRKWRRPPGGKVAFAKPEPIGGHGVAFAAQTISTRRAGHPKQAHRPEQRVIGDILVAVVGADGRLVHDELVERELRVPARSAAAEQMIGLRLVSNASGLGVFYADRAESFLDVGTSARPSAEDGPADLTIYHPVGRTSTNSRGWIVHDDRSDFVGLPASGTAVGRERRAFVAVQAAATRTPQQRRAPQRLRVVLAEDRLRDGR